MWSTDKERSVPGTKSDQLNRIDEKNWLYADCGLSWHAPSFATPRGLGRFTAQVPHRSQRLDGRRTGRSDCPDRCAGSCGRISACRSQRHRLILTTPQWFPVDSGYEAATAASLVAEGRQFNKPLRFDSGQDQVFPDFSLLDAGDPLPMEVWWMADADYVERKTANIAHYDEKYGAGNW